MRVHLFLLTVVVCLIPSQGVAEGDRRLEPLSERDVAQAVQLERQTLVPLLGLPLGKRPIAKLQVQPESLRGVTIPRELRDASPAVSVVGAPDLLPEGAPRRAQVIRHDYETGLTLETTVDLDSGKVLDYSVRENRPAPLTDAEVEYAITLAKAQSSAFQKAAASRGKDDPGFVALLFSDGNPSSKSYRHRLLLLSMEALPDSPRVLVDLSTQRVGADE